MFDDSMTAVVGYVDRDQVGGSQKSGGNASDSTSKAGMRSVERSQELSVGILDSDFSINKGGSSK